MGLCDAPTQRPPYKHFKQKFASTPLMFMQFAVFADYWVKLTAHLLFPRIIFFYVVDMNVRKKLF